MSSLRAKRRPGNVKTLATQYRLSIAPKRVSTKKVDRTGNKESTSLDNKQAEDDAASETPERKRSIRRIRLSEVADAEDFNFEDISRSVLDYPISTQTFLSSSGVVKQNKRFFPSADSDDDTDSPGANTDYSQKAYVCACKHLQVTVNKNFHRSLITNKVTFLNQRLSRNDTKASAIALLRNAKVESLTLDANDLGNTEGVTVIADILPQKPEITELNITNNAIGSVGARELCRVLMDNVYIRKLNLTGNGFIDDDAIYFRDLMEENHGLRHLNLSNNDFRERGGELLAEGISKNDFLQSLDLSWNHLRLSGAVAIGKSMQENQFLERLNLGWNGFHVRGCAALGEALKTNCSLTYLDLTCNRVTEMSLSQLLKGLIENTTLRVLKLPLNPLYPSGALTLLKVMDKYDKIAVNEVDLGTQTVTREFESLLSSLREKRALDIVYGHVLRDMMSMSAVQDELDLDGEKTIDDLMSENPILVLMEYARQQNFRVIDIFKTMDVDQSGSLTKEEFKVGLQKVDITLPGAALGRLIDGLDTDKSGSVDFSELLAGYQTYKAVVREAANSNSTESSEIGQIGEKIRQVMKKKFIMRHF
ncbi:leucine-rich repeat-containing protein 74B-like [Gigantopelta aegis]|uniref:leucine-rich repeat-containing protein 74B-like n=1 Tax=Gigantopelta aegis TaxID=1735272 RepID=UPI001B887E73|nr:leucine-rich repeat-containing protein 74B-like [Gigantopelta aegis]